jgi:putative oxidoreductase
MKISELVKKVYFWSCGYSYTNLGRMFLRLFVGIMMLQFGVRQLVHFDEAVGLFPSICGMQSTTVAVAMICIEIICSLFIMFGFLTRLMTIPPFVAMVVAEYYLLTSMNVQAPYALTWMQPGYLPIMFLGVYFFILLVGPGKISIDYFLSLHIIHTDDKNEETELEEV